MNKKNNNKGFTLAELLIVVAIIAVLVAIAVPVFTSQLEKSREATDLSNIRSAYAGLVTQYLEDGASNEVKIKSKQAQAGWQGNESTIQTMVQGSVATVTLPADKTNGAEFTVSINTSGSITVT